MFAVTKVSEPMTTLDCGFVLPESVRQELLAILQEMRDDFKRFSESMEETRAVSKVEEAMSREKAEALECASNLKIPASVKEMEEFPHQSTNGSGKKIAHQLFDQMPSKEKQKEIQQFTIETEEEMEDMMKEELKQQQGDREPLVSVPDFDAKVCVNKEFKEAVAGCEKKKKGLKSWMFKYKKGNKKRDLLLLNGKASLALRAIGTGLETVERDSSNQEKSKLCTEDKRELKGCLERLQASVLLKEESESMVVNEVKAEFNTFDKKSSNKTLSLEDEQDDEHEQNQVIKLISSLKNRIWEPGGVLIEHDRWKELEKCYKHDRLMRLMQPLSSMWWQLSKPRELERLGACSFVDIKMWLDLCSREYKNHMLLLDYQGIEMQVLSCLLEIGFRTSMSMGSKTRLWIRDSECIRKRKVDLSLITHCKMSLLEYTKEVEILSEKTVVDRIERWMEIQIKAFTSRDTKEDKSWITFNKIIDTVKETVVELMQKLGETGLIMKFPSKVKDALDGLVKGHYGLLHTFDQYGGLNVTEIAGTIIQSSLKLFHQLRVACLHHTSLGFLYGSLPRPPEEVLRFCSMNLEVKVLLRGEI